jgi:hypothetical protein
MYDDDKCQAILQSLLHIARRGEKFIDRRSLYVNGIVCDLCDEYIYYPAYYIDKPCITLSRDTLSTDGVESITLCATCSSVIRHNVKKVDGKFVIHPHMI